MPKLPNRVALSEREATIIVYALYASAATHRTLAGGKRGPERALHEDRSKEADALAERVGLDAGIMVRRRAAN